jgi:hypothetical protein
LKEKKKIWKNEIKRFSSSGYYIICLYSKNWKGETHQKLDCLHHTPTARRLP